MTSIPFGIDFGNNNTVVAVAKGGSLDIVVNEVSNRSTPTLVGFGNQNRFIGEAGKSQQTSNVKNTVDNIKRILGLPFDHPDIAKESDHFKCSLVDIDGKAGVKVRFQGEEHQFTSVQLAAMYFNKIKETVQKETQSIVRDVVIAVPAWYSQVQRHAVCDAARIASLNPVRVVNEVTAAAVGFGLLKTNKDIPEDKPYYYAFVDIGHSSYEVSITQLNMKTGDLKVLGTAYDKFFGGRDFDKAIVDHYVAEIQEKIKQDVTKIPKSMIRLYAAAEKLKKILSANTQAPFNVESIYQDTDFSSTMKRSTLEELVAPLLERVSDPIERALKQANLTKEQIDFVEVIGGGTRVPILKQKISEAFGKPLSMHLNSDEAVAKGATFISCFHSPTLKVREFKFTDINPYSISYEWTPQDCDDDVNSLDVFKRDTPFPCTKLFTVERNGDFEIQAKYTNPEELPAGTPVEISKWKVTGVEVPDGRESVGCKIRVRLNENGVPTVTRGFMFEEVEVEVEVPWSGEGEAPEDYVPEKKTVKKTRELGDLEVVITDSSMSKKVLNQFTEKELELKASDELVFKTQNKRNAIEEYIYEFREKLDGIYKPFVTEEEAEKLRAQLNDFEEWLYDNEVVKYGKLVAKYEELVKDGNLVRMKYNDAQNQLKEKENEKKEAEQYAKLTQKMSEKKEEKQEEKKDETKEEKDKDGDVAM